MGIRALAITALLLTHTGCCTMARVFCGPDKSPWVSIDVATPEASVRTLLEALRRDEPEVLYLCLAASYQQKMGIDDLTVQLGWERFKAANPGLHVAGYAQVPTAKRLAADRAEIQLAIEGRAMLVQLQRQTRWRARYERPPLPPRRPGEAPIPTSAGEASGKLDDLAAALTIRPVAQDIEASTLTLAPLRLEHGGMDALALEQLEFLGIERLWKITDLRLLE